MLNACMTWPPKFQGRYRRFLPPCDEVDEEFGPWLADRAGDVIVDDKVCAYHAADYLLWGGHLRKYDATGEEIHAETTRPYLRGIAQGARRVLCTAALANHSPRRLLAEPTLSFATAGFPRERRFAKRW